MDYLDYDEELIGEAPCEFCGDLYPLILLIEHQTTHLENEAFDDANILQNIMQGENKTPKVEEIIPKVDAIQIKPKISVEQKQTQGFVTDPTNIEGAIYTQIEQFDKKSVESSVKTMETKQNEFKKNQTQTIEEFTTKSGEKLLVYGAPIDPENENETYKLPNNPLLSSVQKEEDIEDINNLSDDDSDESLEEFWKRARDFLKRNRGKTECY